MILRTLKTGSGGNCYALIGKGILVLDAGVPFREITKAVEYRTSDISGCLVTHIHGDHIKYASELTRAGIRVYSNQETVYAYNKGIMALPERKLSRVGGFDVIPFYVPHLSMEDGELVNCPNFAYIIRNDELGTMLYATDFEFLPFTFRKMRLNHILIECNHMDDLVNRNDPNFEHVIRGHSSLGTVVEIVKANKTTDLQNIILCHLSGKNADADVMVDAVEQAAGAGVNVEIAKGDIQLLDVPFL